MARPAVQTRQRFTGASVADETTADPWWRRRNFQSPTPQRGSGSFQNSDPWPSTEGSNRWYTIVSRFVARVEAT